MSAALPHSDYYRITSTATVVEQTTRIVLEIMTYDRGELCVAHRLSLPVAAAYALAQEIKDALDEPTDTARRFAHGEGKYVSIVRKTGWLIFGAPATSVRHLDAPMPGDVGMQMADDLEALHGAVLEKIDAGINFI